MQCYWNGVFMKFLLDCHHFHADLGCLLLTADLYNKSIVAESMRMKNLSLTNGSCDSFMLELAFRLWVTCFWLLDCSNTWVMMQCWHGSYAWFNVFQSRLCFYTFWFYLCCTFPWGDAVFCTSVPKKFLCDINCEQPRFWSLTIWSLQLCSSMAFDTCY